MPLKSIHPIAREPLSETIYKSLKASILNGELAPGERIRELELSRLFDTSQGPVREALKHLEQEGLVIREPYKGTFISQVTNEEVHEVYVLRILIEGIAVKRFMDRAASRDIERLQELICQMKKAAVENDVATLVEHDMMFHQYICEQSGSNLLLQIWMIIHGKARIVAAMGNRLQESNLNDIAGMHQPLLDSISAGNIVKAFDLINTHTRTIWDRLPKSFWERLPKEKNKEPFSVPGTRKLSEEWNIAAVLADLLNTGISIDKKSVKKNISN
jgi:DNA-binding GntR family transcriptional regulator